MTEDSAHRKMRFRWMKHSHSDPRLPQDAAAGTPSGHETSSLHAPPRRSNLSFGKLWGKLSKKESARSTPSSNSAESAHPVISPSGQDLSSTQTDQIPLPLIAPTPEANSDQVPKFPAANAGTTDPKIVTTSLENAHKSLSGASHVPDLLRNTVSATANTDSVLNPIDTFSNVLKPLKAFNSIANGIAEVHPYAKVALSILTSASKMILDQADRDDAVYSLLSKVSEVFAFMTEEEELAKITSMLAVYGKVARQTLECADFITHYSETKSAWKRLGKHIVKDTDATIKSYSEVLDNLMQQFRDQVARDTVIILHRSAEDLDFSGMEYASGAGMNTIKRCLPGTREDILSEIKSWIGSTGDDVPRVLWLSGTAGKGKSAIAHTIANWSNEVGCLGACFCFDHTRVADRRQEKIFTTIARDLADCNPAVRRALADVVHDNNELRHSADITRQWRELLVGPIRVASTAVDAPVLIVIDALDESGDAKSREQILRLLASQLNDLPANFRVMITSRPLEDIHKSIQTASQICHLSMDDISPQSTSSDIERYVCDKLATLGDVFKDTHFQALAQKSDGLFEWARLACEYIEGTNKVGWGPMRRFDVVVGKAAVDKAPVKGTHLLDEMYQHVLVEIMPDEDAIPLFQSVMGQILASREPLPKTALTSMRQQFPQVDSDYNVDDVIRPMGSLLTGTIDSQTPIRPLHASFYNFLTDKSRSDKFFIDISAVESDLAFASLCVMEHELHFNICSLESSYLPNSAVHDLDARVKGSISTELSYSCRFWGTHVGAASFEQSLATEVAAFFDDERLLFWIEALGLMRSFGSAARSLILISDWCTGYAEFTQISDAARDTLRFVRMFGAAILHSTPHLYLSALPFAPKQSGLCRKFAAKFPCTPQVVAGHVLKWPATEKTIRMHDWVRSVAISPDGKRIAGSSDDRDIQVWDIETGMALGAPLRGHTAIVWSMAISPDGKHIVSGSWDHTIRVWDLETGDVLGSPLRGHTDAIYSVIISPDGKRIVSGSHDTTIRQWDVEAGNAFGAPLQGHTECVLSVAISPDGQRIVSGSHDNTIRMWDAHTGEAFGVPLQGHVGAVNSVAISPDGKRIVSGSEDTTIRVWDADTGEALGVPLHGHTDFVRSIAISSNGKRIVSGSGDQTIRVWDMETGEAVGTPLRGHTADVYSVTISPNGKHIVSGSADSTVRVWDALPVEIEEAFGAQMQGHTNGVYSVAISSDEKRIVSGSLDCTIRVWDMETGKALGVPLQGHSDYILSAAISSDGKHIVSGSRDKTIRVWDVETGKAVGAPLRGHTETVRSVTISLDGKRILSCSDDSTRAWDLETGEELGAPIQGYTGQVLSVVISSNGKHIVSGSSDSTVCVWDAKSGEALGAPLRGHTARVRSVVISLDGKCIVSGSWDHTIRMWDVESGKELGAPLRGHTSSVLSVAISPDGRHIVSGSVDNTIRVWDAASGEALGAPLRGHTGVVHSVAISPKGKWIVSGSLDRSIRVWDFESLHKDHHFTATKICFSPNLTYALYSESTFSRVEDSCTPASLGPSEEGWVIGPEGRLLLWIPTYLYPEMHVPGNKLVISNDASELDLSRFAHGTSWEMCRGHSVVSSSS